MKKTLYQTLGVEPTASQADIADGYSRCLKALEEGAYDHNARVIAKEAYNVLSNDHKRALYDMSLRTPPPVPPAPPARRSASVDWRTVVTIIVFVKFAVFVWYNYPRLVRLFNPPAPVAAPALTPPPVTQIVTMPEPVVRTVDEPRALPSADMSSEQLFATLAPGIVRINVSSAGGRPASVGSGVVIAPRTVITNCHVAERGTVLQVKSGNSSYLARLVLADQAHDLCKLDVPLLQAEPLPIGRSSDLRTGQKVIAIGAPHGLDLTISEGIVSSLREVDDGTLIQTTAPVSPGSSGGGLFDMRGNLVGIVTFQVSTGQNLNFAAPAEWIERMTATQGNGIITKLTGPRLEQRADLPDNESSLTAELPGRWGCRDTIRDKIFQIDFEPNGNLEMRRDNATTQGRWRLIGERIEVRPFNNPAMQVEYLKGDKLILYVGKGMRLVCTRT